MFTALNTIPSLAGKSREIRVLFADTANEALVQGRSESEAIFKALNVVKLKEQQSIKKFVPQSVPAHLAAILNVRSVSNLAQEAQQQLEKEKATLSSQQPSNDVVGAVFDSKGRLVLKLKDGKTITSNVAPITAVEHNVIVVGSQGVQGATPEEVEGLKLLTYTGEDLSRVDMPDGSYKLLTYTNTLLTQVDHVQATQTVRKTLFYTTGVLTSVNTEII